MKSARQNLEAVELNDFDKEVICRIGSFLQYRDVLNFSLCNKELRSILLETETKHRLGFFDRTKLSSRNANNHDSSDLFIRSSEATTDKAEAATDKAEASTTKLDPATDKVEASTAKLDPTTDKVEATTDKVPDISIRPIASTAVEPIEPEEILKIIGDKYSRSQQDGEIQKLNENLYRHRKRLISFLFTFVFSSVSYIFVPPAFEKDEKIGWVTLSAILSIEFVLLVLSLNSIKNFTRSSKGLRDHTAGYPKEMAEYKADESTIDMPTIEELPEAQDQDDANSIPELRLSRMGM